MRHVDLLVVGAGPAGTAAAITAARSGLDTMVVDKAVFPRDKICGDGLTTGALRQLDALGVAPDDIGSWQDTDRCWVRSPSGHEVCFPLPTGSGKFAAVATRVDLDDALVQQARKAGADVMDGHALQSASEDDDGITAQIDGIGEVHAPWAIGADGMWSPLRKQLGVAPQGYLGEWHGFRQYAHGVTGVAATDLYIAFDADLVPGYFWAFPLPGGRANVGFGVQRDGTRRVRDMKELWPDLLDRPHIRAALGPDVEFEETHRAWPIPARVDDAVPTSRRALFVGDAVAACDVMTGEGIGQALQTGTLAASTVAAAGPHGDAATRYSAALRSEMVADHRMSELLVRGLSTPRGASNAVRIAGANDWTRRNFARWLFEDYPRALLATPRRWRRGIASRPGAYTTRS